MTVWQYAQLRVTRDDRLASSSWMIAWYGPDTTTQDTAEVYSEVVAELNRAGTQGWELVNVVAMDAGDGRYLSGERDWSLTRYTFRRPHDLRAARRAEPDQQGESPRSQPIRTGQPGPPQDDNLAGSMTAQPGTLVRLTAYWQPDREAGDETTEDLDPGSTPGRLLVRREAVRPGQADIAAIESFRVEYQKPGISADRRKEIEDAASDYAASWIEGQFGVTWWQTPQHLVLSQAADVLNGSAEWLCGLVKDPLADAASTIAAAGPLVDIGAGITANLATEPLTAPLEGAARACEIAGIVIGLATGTPPLVMACAHRLAHDETGRLLSRGFKQVITSIGADRDRKAAAVNNLPHPDHEPPAPKPFKPRLSHSPQPSQNPPGTAVPRPDPGPRPALRNPEPPQGPTSAPDAPRQPPSGPSGAPGGPG